MKPTRTLPIAIFFFTLINSFLARWESNREQEVLQNSGKRIIPGAEWKDTDGNLIQAHGAGIIKVKDTWYWFGEDKTKNNHAFLGISCYSSRDLASWKRHPNVLQVSEDDNSALNKNQVIERPKSSNYGLAQVGVATSTRVDRDWKFIKAFSPLNSQSRDMSLYQDDDPDKTAYISFASDGNANLKIAKLSEDYLDVVELVYKWDRVFWEATGIVKNNGIYTMLYSKQDGWNPNPNSAMQAYNISGPWQAPTLIAPQNVKTYSSQNTYDFTVKGSEITSFIYAGDRWFPKSLGESTYIWLPLLIQGTKISLIWADIWSINSKTGKVTIETGEAYDAKQAEKNGNNIIFTNIRGPQAEGQQQWCCIYYSNPGKNIKNGELTANNLIESTTKVKFSGVNGVISVPVSVALNPGKENSITIKHPDSVTLHKIIMYD